MLKGNPQVALKGDFILSRDARGNTKFFAWFETVAARAQLEYESIHGELFFDPPVETSAQMLARLSEGLIEEPLESESSRFLPDEEYLRTQRLPANQRDRAEDAAVELMPTARTARNTVRRAENENKKQILKVLISYELAKPPERVKIVSWLLSDKCMTAACAMEVTASGNFLTGPGASNSPRKVINIVKRVLGGMSGTDLQRRMEQDDALRAMRHSMMA